MRLITELKQQIRITSEELKNSQISLEEALQRQKNLEMRIIFLENLLSESVKESITLSSQIIELQNLLKELRKSYEDYKKQVEREIRILKIKNWIKNLIIFGFVIDKANG